MPSLTHVCMFYKHSWKRVTPEEAAEIFPETVSAHGGLFMCELCGQYVSLTKEGKKIRHFRHRSREADKSCPERTFGSEQSIDFLERTHSFPIRINPSNLSLEIGLLSLPRSTLELLKDQKIRICPVQEFGRSFTYILRERLRENEIVYVSIGNEPYPEYEIELDGRSIPAFSYWPDRVQGIDPKGTLFDASTRKKLPYDADVRLGKTYHLLRAGSAFSPSASIRLKQVLSKYISGRYWHLYEVMANDFDESAAKFFLDFHCRLTDQPISLQPVWPIYTTSPYVIRHNRSEMFFYVSGNVNHTKCFPSPMHTVGYPAEDGTVERIACNNRQQLVSVGRTKMLRYSYVWREPLDQITSTPTVLVTDIEGRTIEPEIYGNLPLKGVLRIQAPYDGSIAVKKSGRIVEKRRIRAETLSEIGPIQFGCEVQVFQGLDCVWSIQFQKQLPLPDQEESLLLQKLQSSAGPQIAVPHVWGAIAERLEAYPRVKQWLYARIREGRMPERAYKELRCFIEREAAK